MRILMLSDGEWRGGANTAAHRLARGLASLDCEVIRVVRHVDDEHPVWERHVLVAESAPEVPWSEVPNRPAMVEVEGQLDRLCRDLRPDVVSIHNLHGGIRSGWSFNLVGVCLEHAPVAFTMHDMWSFTGRCAYCGPCRDFLVGCGPQCPTATEYPACPPQLVAGEYALRRRILGGGGRLGAVSPSAWLAREARAGLWASRPVAAIANGLDLDLYRPVPRDAARRALGMESRGPVLLAACASFADPRKGAGLLASALPMLPVRPLTVLTMGRGGEALDVPGVDAVHLGYVAEEERRALAYAAADAFVMTSSQENLPNTVAEALACGTPVTALAVGGVPEMIRSGRTGTLALEPTARALADALAELLGSATPDQRSSCRSWAEEQYDERARAKDYLEFFGRLAREPFRRWPRENEA